MRICSSLLLFVLLFNSDIVFAAQPIRYQNFDAKQIARADSLLGIARTRLSKVLLDSLNFPATIVLTKTSQEFDLHVGGHFPDWGAAAAIPRQSLIVIKSPLHFPLRRSLDELLVHEYSHLALGALTTPNSAPRWLDEGLAMYLASAWTWEENLLMSRTAVFGSFPLLDAIDEVNAADEAAAELSYATSRLAFEYFLSRFGPEGVAGLCWALREGFDREGAFEHATGLRSVQFGNEFIAHLRERYDFLTLILDMQYFWLLLAILLIIGGVMRWLSKRSYERRWREQERIESTDFDYGDPKRPESIEDDEPWRGERDRD